MPDIRKMLEKQMEALQDASMNTEVAAECTHAMLSIIDVLYPEGIPEADKVGSVGNVKAKITLDTDEIVSQVLNTICNQNSREIMITI